MTPADRAALIARAKQVAAPVASCVAGGVRPDHLIGDWGRNELAALVIVLADAADPVRLRAVTRAPEDGPDITNEDLRLRKAHAEVAALRTDGKPIPPWLAMLESRYQQQRRQGRRTRLGGPAASRPIELWPAAAPGGPGAA